MADATRIGAPPSSAIAGTWNTPPPTPNNAETIPAVADTATIAGVRRTR